MNLEQMLSECLEGSEPVPSLLPTGDDGFETGLPASVLDWPEPWRQLYEEASRVNKQLLPICALHAEAAAEIVLRCIWANQSGGRLLS